MGTESWIDASGTDKTTKAAILVPHALHKLHEGDSYSSHYTTTTAATDDHRTAIAFKTPDTAKWGHLVITITSSQLAEFFLLESPTTLDVNKGSGGNIFNRNRNSSNASGMLSNDSPPIEDAVSTYTEAQLAIADGGANFVNSGTQVEYVVLAGGGGPRVVGGNSRGEQEFILKQDTLYMFLLQNIGANANIHLLNLDWYEHTNP